APPARPCTAPAAPLPPPTTAPSASRRHPRLTLGVSRHLLDDDTMPPLIRVTLTPTVRGCPPIWHQRDKNGALTSSAIPSAVPALLWNPLHATPSLTIRSTIRSRVPPWAASTAAAASATCSCSQRCRGQTPSRQANCRSTSRCTSSLAASLRPVAAFLTSLGVTHSVGMSST